MNELIIVGAGGFGREVYNWSKQCPEYGKDWTIKGFLDDNANALDGYDYPVPILGPISDYQPQAGEVFAAGIGIVSAKKKICTELKSRGARFVTLVHPSAVLGGNVYIGEGSIVCPNVTITSDIRVGDFVLVNCNSCIGHDSTVGDWTTISALCDITGYCTIGDEVFLGSQVSVIPSRTVGKGALLGAGSVVIRDVKPGTTVIGVPARELM